VFGVSFTEFLVLGTVALLVLGPEKLPGMLRTMGQWIAKLRKLSTEVRHQSGIDEVLRAEGFDGGLNELRSMMRGGAAGMAMHTPAPVRQPLPDPFVADKSREYPAEGPDAYGALPDDLVTPAAPALPEAAAAHVLPVSGPVAALPPAEPLLPDASATGATSATAVPAATVSSVPGSEPLAATSDPPEATR
jgi:sec-independent protein translocase protein TatB